MLKALKTLIFPVINYDLMKLQKYENSDLENIWS